MANGRKLNEVTNVSTLASSDRLVSVRTSDGKTVQISLTDFMNTLPAGSIITATVGDEQITDAKLEKRAALSVMGNATNATDAPADITAGSDNTVLKRDGNSLVFDEVKAADIDMSDLISSLIDENPHAVFRESLSPFGENIADANSAPSAGGWYYGYNTANVPGSNRQYVLQFVYPGTQGHRFQLAFVPSSMRVYFRGEISGEWSAWREVNATPV